MRGRSRVMFAVACVLAVAFVGIERAAADHTVLTLSPSALPQGTQNRQVVINGSGFSDRLGPVSVQVSGSGVDVSQVQVTSPTRITASFSVTTVAAIGFRNVTVTQGLLGSDTVECQRCLRISAPTGITAFSPPSGSNTTTVDLVVTGSGFVTGSVIRLRKTGFEDVVATGLTAGAGGTTLRGTLDLTGQAPGRWIVLVDNPDGGHAESGDGTTTGFLVSGGEPTITSAPPGEGAAGASGLELVLSGTNFARGATVTLSGTGISVTDPVWLNLTSFEVVVNIAPNAPGGRRDVTLTNVDGKAATLVNGFAVTTRVSSITPSSGANTGPVAITEIAGGGFAADVSVRLERPGFVPVHLSNPVISANGTKISGTFDLKPSGALPVAPGPWTVRVHNPGTQTAATLPNGFTVTSSPPAVTSVEPIVIGQGAIRTVRVNGAHFADRSAVSVSGVGVEILAMTVLSATGIDAVLRVAPDAALGVRSVTVTNTDGQTVTAADAFTIVPAPTTTSISPSSINQGTTRGISVAGTGYSGTPTLGASGSGVTFSNVVRQSATALTTSVAVAANAPPGPRNVTVTNPDGGSSICTGCLVVVAGGAVRLDGWHGVSDPMAGSAGVTSVLTDSAWVFYRAPDNSVRFRNIQGSGWSNPIHVGGIALSGPSAAASGGRADVVVRGADDAVWVNNCSAGACSGWSTIGGRTREEPAVVSWGPGRLDVFVMGLDRQLWQRSRIDDSWGPWSPLGGVLSAGPAATSTGTGNLEVAVRGSDGGVYVKSFNGSWSPYVTVGGFIVDEPALVARPGGFVDLFVRAIDDRLWYGRRSGGTWVGFQPLGGVITAAPAAALMSGDSPNPAIQIAVRGGDGRLWVNRARFS